MFPSVYVSWAIFVLLAAFFILRRVRRDYRHFRQLRPFTAFLQVLMFFIHGVLVGLSYGLSFKWPPFSQSLASIAVGAVFAAVGVTILASALQVFGPIKRMLGLKKDELKWSGVYGWTRNPQIVGYGLMLLSIPLLWPSWYAWVSVALYCPIAHGMVTIEEEHLNNLFGEDYQQYCTRTPRYLGLALVRRSR